MIFQFLLCLLHTDMDFNAVLNMAFHFSIDDVTIYSELSAMNPMRIMIRYIAFH